MRQFLYIIGLLLTLALVLQVFSVNAEEGKAKAAQTKPKSKPVRHMNKLSVQWSLFSFQY